MMLTFGRQRWVKPNRRDSERLGFCCGPRYSPQRRPISFLVCTRGEGINGEFCPLDAGKTGSLAP